MEMDVYDHESYLMSIGNLYMLKLFHDEGVIVCDFSNFMVHTQNNTGGCSEIFEDGIKQLIDDFNRFEYGDNIDAFCKMYPDLIQEDGAYSCPEFIYTFKDKEFQKVLSSKNYKSIKEMLPALKKLGDRYEEFDIVILPDYSGVAYFFYTPSYLYAIDLYAIAKGILILKKEAIRLNKLSERMLEDGHTDQLLNKKSA